jgi:hypothetical protein
MTFPFADAKQALLQKESLPRLSGGKVLKGMKRLLLIIVIMLIIKE